MAGKKLAQIAEAFSDIVCMNDAERAFFCDFLDEKVYTSYLNDYIENEYNILYEDVQIFIDRISQLYSNRKTSYFPVFPVYYPEIAKICDRGRVVYQAHDLYFSAVGKLWSEIGKNGGELGSRDAMMALLRPDWKEFWSRRDEYERQYGCEFTHVKDLWQLMFIAVWNWFVRMPYRYKMVHMLFFLQEYADLAYEQVANTILTRFEKNHPLKADNSFTKRLRANEVKKLKENLWKWDVRSKRHVYMSQATHRHNGRLNIFSSGIGKHGSETAYELRFMFLDFDHTDGKEQIEFFEKVGLQPFMIVNSGRGVHFYFRVCDPKDGKKFELSRNVVVDAEKLAESNGWVDDFYFRRDAHELMKVTYGKRYRNRRFFFDYANEKIIYNKLDKERVDIYKSFIEKVIKCLDDIGVDRNVSSVAQLMRVPGTWNYRAKKYAKVLMHRDPNSVIYPISNDSEFLLRLGYVPQEETEQKETEQKETEQKETEKKEVQKETAQQEVVQEESAQKEQKETTQQKTEQEKVQQEAQKEVQEQSAHKEPEEKETKQETVQKETQPEQKQTTTNAYKVSNTSKTTYTSKTEKTKKKKKLRHPYSLADIQRKLWLLNHKNASDKRKVLRYLEGEKRGIQLIRTVYKWRPGFVSTPLAQYFRKYRVAEGHRNNTVFSLALIFRQEDYTEKEALDWILKNVRFEGDFSQSEVIRTVHSAYQTTLLVSPESLYEILAFRGPNMCLIRPSEEVINKSLVMLRGLCYSRKKKSTHRTTNTLRRAKLLHAILKMWKAKKRYVTRQDLAKESGLTMNQVNAEMSWLRKIGILVHKCLPGTKLKVFFINMSEEKIAEIEAIIHNWPVWILSGVFGTTAISIEEFLKDTS